MSPRPSEYLFAPARAIQTQDNYAHYLVLHGKISIHRERLRTSIESAREQYTKLQGRSAKRSLSQDKTSLLGTSEQIDL
jgi:hypothetical protein